MSKIHIVINTIVQQGMLPLYFHADENTSIEVLRALYRAGIKAVEYTSRGETAANNFTKMVAIRNAEMPDLLLGIGTIKTKKQAEKYIEIGADFFISPGFVPEVAALLKEKEMLQSRLYDSYRNYCCREFRDTIHQIISRKYVGF